MKSAESPSDSLESESNPHISSHGHSGVELTRPPPSARTSKQKSNCNAKAEESQDQIAKTVERDDRRTQNEEEEPERAHDRARGALAALQRQALGGQLAEDDVQRGYDHEGDSDCDCMRAGCH